MTGLRLVLDQAGCAAVGYVGRMAVERWRRTHGTPRLLPEVRTDPTDGEPYVVTSRLVAAIVIVASVAALVIGVVDGFQRSDLARRIARENCEVGAARLASSQRDAKQLADALDRVLAKDVTPASARVALVSLRDYSRARAQTTRDDPLPLRVITDCRDGVLGSKP